MWQRYTHLYVEMKRFCEGQNTCVAIFKDSQLNLVAVSKWGLTEEMRVIKKTLALLQRIIGTNSCRFCTNHTVTKITRIMIDSFEHSIRCIWHCLKNMFRADGPLSIWQCGRLNTQFWMKFEIAVSYSCICIL
jgi:hypothetical protein